MKETKSEKKEAVKIYTCSMHPEVKSNKPGKCPKCGMDLIEKKQSIYSKYSGNSRTEEKIKQLNKMKEIPEEKREELKQHLQYHQH